jgi:hypothetical protein
VRMRRREWQVIGNWSGIPINHRQESSMTLTDLHLDIEMLEVASSENSDESRRVERRR